MNSLKLTLRALYELRFIFAFALVVGTIMYLCPSNSEAHRDKEIEVLKDLLRQTLDSMDRQGQAMSVQGETISAQSKAIRHLTDVGQIHLRSFSRLADRLDELDRHHQRLLKRIYDLESR